MIVTEDYAPKDEKKAEYLGRFRYVHKQQIGANAFWTREKIKAGR